MSACPGVDMRELGLFAGQQGGPKYEQPSSDVPLHQASRAGKIKKSLSASCATLPLIIMTVSRQLALRRQWRTGRCRMHPKDLE